MMVVVTQVLLVIVATPLCFVLELAMPDNTLYTILSCLTSSLGYLGIGFLDFHAL